jgi:predicted transposase YdaD
MGMRYPKGFAAELLRGVGEMKESVTYQAIIEEGKAEGKAEEARKILLLQGRSRFGEPSSKAVAALDALTDVQKLEELTVRLLQAASWADLLGLNGPSRRGRGRRKTSRAP